MSLAGCEDQAGGKLPPTKPAKAYLPADIRPELEACFAETAIVIPDRDLTGEDIARIIARARAVDFSKSKCGKRAIAWIGKALTLAKGFEQ